MDYLLKIVAGGLAETPGNDNAKIIVAANFVIIHLNGFVDLTERNVYFAQHDVLVVGWVCVELNYGIYVRLFDVYKRQVLLAYRCNTIHVSLNVYSDIVVDVYLDDIYICVRQHMDFERIQ